MANSTIANGSFTIGDPATGTAGFTLAVNTTQTGSNLSYNIPNITSGSWQPLVTGSITGGTRWAVFQNLGTGSIRLAGTSGGGGINPVLSPGDFCVLPFSGSVNQQLYAQSVYTNDSNALQYGVQEN